MKVLIFGGTQFIGRITVEALLRDGHDVVMFNRGRTANPFGERPKLRHVRCDRMDDREGFRNALRNEGHSAAIIDFIGFQEIYMQDVLDALSPPSGMAETKQRFTTEHYIFVSTDSVYWTQKLPSAEARLSEDDARDFSPSEMTKHLEYCHLTSLGDYQFRYGGNKRGCERVLETAWKESGFPYTILRLPDVYGPYDNLGGFWELVQAVEMRRPVATNLQMGRTRLREGTGSKEPRRRRFCWAFAEDVRDAIMACLTKGAVVHGSTMHIAHEEAVNIYETTMLVTEAMGLEVEDACFDDARESSFPSTDYGVLDVSRALRLLRPWRPTAMREAVRRSVKWFLTCTDHRRYHRLVHRGPRQYDDSMARCFVSSFREVKSCWVGAPDKCTYLRDGPVLLCDALPSCTGQAVLAFMQRLMDQAGEMQVVCQLQKGSEIEHQTWTLRHFAGHLLPQSEHAAAYRLEEPHVLAKTDLLQELSSPVADIHSGGTEEPPGRLLCMGGVGARTVLQKVAALKHAESPHLHNNGFWDCALLGRRKWRLFPPDTLPSDLCAGDALDKSPVDCFVCGPDSQSVHRQHTRFAPATSFECEQTMGQAVAVPAGWWYQTYDDDRTLSISARYGHTTTGNTASDTKAPAEYEEFVPDVSKRTTASQCLSQQSHREVCALPPKAVTEFLPVD